MREHLAEALNPAELGERLGRTLDGDLGGGVDLEYGRPLLDEAGLQRLNVSDGSRCLGTAQVEQLGACRAHRLGAPVLVAR